MGEQSNILEKIHGSSQILNRITESVIRLRYPSKDTGFRGEASLGCP